MSRLLQIGVCDKTNEIPISIEILDAFDVSNKVITTDALLTQKPFCQAILNAGGDYVLPAKMNQKSLFSAIEKLFKIHRIQQIWILEYIFTGATRIADMMKYYASNPKLAVNIIK